MSEFASVRAFVADWADKPLDILINNAGATFPRFTLTPDGYEATYGVNFLSGFLLTLLLLPRLTESARVVNVSSAGSYRALNRDVDPKDLDGSKFIRSQGIEEGEMFKMMFAFGLYAKSKLNQVVFTRVLQEKLDGSEKYGGKNIVVSACHPGAVRSSIHGRHLGLGTKEEQKGLYRWNSLMNTLGVSCEQGACTPVFVAVDPSVTKQKGLFWDRNTARTPNSLVEDWKLRNELWNAWVEECNVADVV